MNYEHRRSTITRSDMHTNTCTDDNLWCVCLYDEFTLLGGVSNVTRFCSATLTMLCHAVIHGFATLVELLHGFAILAELLHE